MHTQKPDRLLRKYLVHFERFFHSTVANLNKIGTAEFGQIMLLHVYTYILFRYEKELHPTYWANIRQGAVYGVFVGWLSLSSFIVYSVGFIFGSMLMSFENENTLNISDIIIVSFLYPYINWQYFFRLSPFLRKLRDISVLSVLSFNHFRKLEVQRHQYFNLLMR